MKSNRQISKFPRHDIVIKRRDCVFPEVSDPGLRSEVVHSGRRPGQNITVRHAFVTTPWKYYSNVSRFNFFSCSPRRMKMYARSIVILRTHIAASSLSPPFCSTLQEIVFRLDFRNCDFPATLELRRGIIFCHGRSLHRVRRVIK